jgi:hypothetical protein
MNRETAIENAWRIYELNVDLIGKVDVKSSLVLVADSAAVATIVSLRDQGVLFASATPWQEILFWVGIVGFLIAAALGLLVVVPRLSRREAGANRSTHVVYFGHVRGRQAHHVQDALLASDLLEQLSDGIVAMARIAWTKHVLTQASVLFTGLATLAIVVAALALP